MYWIYILYLLLYLIYAFDNIYYTIYAALDDTQIVDHLSIDINR